MGNSNFVNSVKKLTSFSFLKVGESAAIEKAQIQNQTHSHSPEDEKVM